LSRARRAARKFSAAAARAKFRQAPPADARAFLLAQATNPHTKRPHGPLRAWPGGLAMSRAIGDADCSSWLIAEPHVRTVALPPGGCDIVLATDGVWDAQTDAAVVATARAAGTLQSAAERIRRAPPAATRPPRPPPPRVRPPSAHPDLLSPLQRQEHAPRRGPAR